MGDSRKQQGESYRQQVGHWNRSYSRKPPLDNWQSTVPSWEKKFCASVGSVPWRKLLESKKYMFLFDNVVKWDDSAGREAFHNAKTRFWAEINGLPCNISLPDPDIYIDDIDWNSSIDPELILDLEKEPKVPIEECEEEKVVILGSSLFLNQSFSCTGWGDAEADLPKANNLFPTSPGWDSDLDVSKGGDPWKQYWAPDLPAKEYKWHNCWNDSWESNKREHPGGYFQKMGNGRAGGNWRTWDGYNRKKENISWQWRESPAYHGDEYQMNRGRRSFRGKRGNFAYDRPYVEKITTPG